MKLLRILAILLSFLSCSFAQKEVPLPKDLPPYGPEKPLQAPQVQQEKLPNGLTVWLVSKPGLPKVSMAIAVRGGLAADPADRPGISELLANTVNQGTTSKTARQIAEQIQSAGGDLDISSNKDAVIISTSVLSPRADTALALLADLIQNAMFPDNEVTLAKRNLSDSLRQRESEPSFLASRAMARVLFGDTPYHVTAPTQESIAASTPADLKKIYAERFRPDQAVFIAVGDFENGAMLSRVQSELGRWKSQNGTPVGVPPHPSTTPKPSVFLVQRPGSVQTTLEFGTFGPTRGDADYEAAQVANAIYGGTFGSRLITNIREDKGYTYSPFSNLSTYRSAGVFFTRADVRNEVTGPSFNEITYELNRMATTSPSKDEMDKARRFLVGIESIRLQSRDAEAGELASLWIDGLSPEEIGIYGQKVSSTTPDQVNAVAKKYFPASHSAVVAVGEEKVVRDALAPFGLPIEVVR
jgi:predicted Zn-dependent peptidase